MALPLPDVIEGVPHVAAHNDERHEINALGVTVSSLSSAVGSKQDQDAELSALAGLESAANKLPYFTGAGTAALTDISAFARTLLDDANQAAMQATLGITGARTFEVTTGATSSTAAKTATIGGGYAYTDADLISVIATNGNVAASPTLNIDGLGAKPIYLGGAPLTVYSGVLVANGRWFLRYDAASDRFDMMGLQANYDIVSQANMEAGTSTTVGYMSPALVAAAIKYIMGLRATNPQTGAYTIVAGDAERMIDFNSATDQNITVPANLTNYPIGGKTRIMQRGAGKPLVVAADGTVTVRNSSSATTRGPWSVIVVEKLAANEYVVYGDVQ